MNIMVWMWYVVGFVACALAFLFYSKAQSYVLDSWPDCRTVTIPGVARHALTHAGQIRRNTRAMLGFLFLMWLLLLSLALYDGELARLSLMSLCMFFVACNFAWMGMGIVYMCRHQETWPAAAAQGEYDRDRLLDVALRAAPYYPRCTDWSCLLRRVFYVAHNISLAVFITALALYNLL